MVPLVAGEFDMTKSIDPSPGAALVPKAEQFPHFADIVPDEHLAFHQGGLQLSKVVWSVFLLGVGVRELYPGQEVLEDVG
jgi:hypothetical protein